ncbi:MAG: hypothetical protein KC621_25515 [Myxococcales bacterium]|nr:hypothetical protein [Myxococcales bacterium]
MLVSMLAATAFAQEVTFALDDAKAQSLGLDTSDLEAQLSAAIDDQLNLSDPNTYVAKYANAVAMSTKGMGVDYASNPKMFSVGGSIGTAVSGVPVSFSRGPENLPEGGYAFMAALHAGLNLGVLTPGDKGPLDHVLIYVSGLGFNPPGSREFEASMYNFGAHAQIVLGGVTSGPAEWGGVALTGGYERSWYKLSLGQALPITQEISPATVTWAAEGAYDLSATADTIPLELSTNLRVTVLTGWVGGGVDIVPTGSATSVASLSGPVSASAAGQNEQLGTIGVSLAGTGQADLQVPRIFMGVQGNLFALKAFGQLNIGLNQTYGGFIGMRVAM